MKVLLLAQFFPPDIGGEERHVLNLSTALAGRGHEVAVATLRLPGTDEREVLPSGVTVHRLPSTAMRLPGLYRDSNRPHHPPVPDPLVVRALRPVVAAHRPDVVHAHNWIVNSALALRSGPFARRSHSADSPGARRPFGLVLTLHDYSHVCATKRMMRDGRPCPGPSPRRCPACVLAHYGPLTGPITLVATTTMRPWKSHGVDHIVSVSRAVADGNGVAGLGVPSSVIPNFVPDDVMDTPPPDPTVLRDLPEGGYLLFVGDLSQEKGVHTLLRAYDRLGPDRPPLVLVGRRLPGLPDTLPVGARIVESLPHAAVIEAFRRCLAAVLPSTWPDPCPTTVLEAMAAGRPVITTAIGGMLDMVEDGVSGLLVEPGDEAGLAHAVQRLLGEPGLAERLGRGGLTGLAGFRAPAVVSRLESVYLSVADRVPVG
ncbi:MAG: glycosyltransferase family 4 protein [Kineosporiaceae bacterium]